MTPWHTDDFAALRQLLIRLDYAARQMVAVLLREYEALQTREAPSPALLHEKADLAAKLETAQEQFARWREKMAKAGKVADDDIPATLDQMDSPNAEELRRSFDDSRQVLLECDRHNAINGRMLHRQHVKNQLFSRLLKQTTSEPLYSSRGQLDRDSGSLGRV